MPTVTCCGCGCSLGLLVRLSCILWCLSLTLKNYYYLFIEFESLLVCFTCPRSYSLTSHRPANSPALGVRLNHSPISQGSQALPLCQALPQFSGKSGFTAIFCPTSRQLFTQNNSFVVSNNQNFASPQTQLFFCPETESHSRVGRTGFTIITLT